MKSRCSAKLRSTVSQTGSHEPGSSQPDSPLDASAAAMKKPKRSPRRPLDPDRDTMRAEYDFSGAVRGDTAERYRHGTNVIALDPAVMDVFPDSASVNEALRALAPVLRRQRRPTSKKRSASLRVEAAGISRATSISSSVSALRPRLSRLETSARWTSRSVKSRRRRITGRTPVSARRTTRCWRGAVPMRAHPRVRDGKCTAIGPKASCRAPTSTTFFGP